MACCWTSLPSVPSTSMDSVGLAPQDASLTVTEPEAPVVHLLARCLDGLEFVHAATPGLSEAGGQFSESEAASPALSSSGWRGRKFLECYRVATAGLTLG